MKNLNYKVGTKVKLHLPFPRVMGFEGVITDITNGCATVALECHKGHAYRFNVSTGVDMRGPECGSYRGVV